MLTTFPLGTPRIYGVYWLLSHALASTKAMIPYDDAGYSTGNKVINAILREE
jgi:hypothetical protein